MARLKGWSRILVTLVVVYGLAWVFVGDHGHTYYLEPAKQTEGTWCPWRIDIVGGFERNVTMLHW